MVSSEHLRELPFIALVRSQGRITINPNVREVFCIKKGDIVYCKIRKNIYLRKEGEPEKEIPFEAKVIGEGRIHIPSYLRKSLGITRGELVHVNLEKIDRVTA